jgi:hypothetical protein
MCNKRNPFCVILYILFLFRLLLSLGQFLNNRLDFDQFMVNPDLYEYFVISEEPLNDRDSRISNIVAGGTRVDIAPNDTIVGGAQIGSSP